MTIRASRPGASGWCASFSSGRTPAVTNTTVAAAKKPHQRGASSRKYRRAAINPKTAAKASGSHAKSFTAVVLSEMQQDENENDEPQQPQRPFRRRVDSPRNCFQRTGNDQVVNDPGHRDYRRRLTGQFGRPPCRRCDVGAVLGHAPGLPLPQDVKDPIRVEPQLPGTVRDGTGPAGDGEAGALRYRHRYRSSRDRYRSTGTGPGVLR